MTFEKFALSHLFNGGMFEDDAKKVVELAKSDEVLKDTMNGRWQDDIQEYPPQLQSFFVDSLNSVAVKYIDETMPKAWFRDVFAVNG